MEGHRGEAQGVKIVLDREPERAYVGGTSQEEVIMKSYTLNLSPEDYEAFRSHPATRLYDHRRTPDGDTTIWTSRPRQLVRDLERVIDFGATSACEVLNLSFVLFTQ